jgi:hypothetical protein
MKDTFVYKIRRADGLYSTGGLAPKFNEKGKVWSGLGPLRNHLNTVATSRGPDHYVNCEVVKVRVSRTVEDAYPIADLTTAMDRERQKAEAARRELAEADEKRRRREQFLTLKAEFEPEKLPSPNGCKPGGRWVSSTIYQEPDGTRLAVDGRGGWRQLGVYDG